MELLLGNCLDRLKELEDNSVDAIVTDPPYGLSFMGKKWDYDVPSVEIWKQCIRVLKPGGYLLSFAGTRTQHRMAINIEDAGFEIRDMIAWVYGSGFPKSLNIGKAVDKLQGNEREYLGVKNLKRGSSIADQTTDKSITGWNRPDYPSMVEVTKGTSEWEGWGTATKPAVEPVSVCTKPLPVSLIFCILGIDLTNKITNLCQKSNVSVSDVEKNLRCIQQLLEKVGVNTVHENARTLSWENIENVVIAATSSTLQGPISTGQTGEDREASVRKNVKQSGKNNLQENLIPTGKAEDLREKMDTLLSTLVTRNIDLNTILLWRSILEDTLEKANMFTTETALEVIIAWKTCNYLLSANTPSFTNPNIEISPNLSPIIMSRKPLSEKTVAENCLKWGVGGINIDGCRVGTSEDQRRPSRGGNNGLNGTQTFKIRERKVEDQVQHNGRFPANLIHDGSEEVVERFPQTGNGNGGKPYNYTGKEYNNKGTSMFNGDKPQAPSNFNDSGSAARFFYCAKASKRERNIGCEGLEGRYITEQNKWTENDYRKGNGEKTKGLTKNNHPTVKPIALMEYLVKLVSRERQVVLDPFMGSGTTGMACKKLNREFIGIEMMPEYMEIAKCRIEGVKKREQLNML